MVDRGLGSERLRFIKIAQAVTVCLIFWIVSAQPSATRPSAIQSSAAQQTQTPEVLSDAIEGLIDIINAARQERRLEPLYFEPRLADIAEELAVAIYQGAPLNNLMDGVEGMLAEKGYPHIVYGALPVITSQTADQVVSQFLSDPSAQGDVLMHPSIQEIGVAYMSSEGSPRNDPRSNIWGIVVAERAVPARQGWNRRILDLVNSFRGRHDLPPLKPNAFLDRAAQRMANDMANRDFFDHIDPDGSNPGERAAAAGYQYSILLENLAAGQRTPQETVNAWIASKDGHREAMLNELVTELGIGYVFLPYDPGRINARHYWALSLGHPQTR